MRVFISTILCLLLISAGTCQTLYRKPNGRQVLDWHLDSSRSAESERFLLPGTLQVFDFAHVPPQSFPITVSGDHWDPSVWLVNLGFSDTVQLIPRHSKQRDTIRRDTTTTAVQNWKLRLLIENREALKLCRQSATQLDSIATAQGRELRLQQLQIAYAHQVDSLRQGQLADKDQLLGLAQSKEQAYITQIKTQGQEIARQKRRVVLVGSTGIGVSLFFAYLLIKK